MDVDEGQVEVRIKLMTDSERRPLVAVLLKIHAIMKVRCIHVRKWIINEPQQ